MGRRAEGAGCRGTQPAVNIPGHVVRGSGDADLPTGAYRSHTTSSMMLPSVTEPLLQKPFALEVLVQRARALLDAATASGG
jgi:hypothetical protein